MQEHTGSWCHECSPLFQILSQKSSFMCLQPAFVKKADCMFTWSSFVLCVLCVLCVVGLLSAVGGPRRRYITASVSQACVQLLSLRQTHQSTKRTLSERTGTPWIHENKYFWPYPITVTISLFRSSQKNSNPEASCFSVTVSIPFGNAVIHSYVLLYDYSNVSIPYGDAVIHSYVLFYDYSNVSIPYGHAVIHGYVLSLWLYRYIFSFWRNRCILPLSSCVVSWTNRLIMPLRPYLNIKTWHFSTISCVCDHILTCNHVSATIS